MTAKIWKTQIVRSNGNCFIKANNKLFILTPTTKWFKNNNGNFIKLNNRVSENYNLIDCELNIDSAKMEVVSIKFVDAERKF